MMLSNMALAFSLNFIGILVIKRMSAVAYVLSGICKDILLVTLGAVMWNEVVTNQRESFTYVACFSQSACGVSRPSSQLHLTARIHRLIGHRFVPLN